MTRLCIKSTNRRVPFGPAATSLARMEVILNASDAQLSKIHETFDRMPYVDLVVFVGATPRDGAQSASPRSLPEGVGLVRA